jgi:uncharacterized protein (DUF736 family)
MAEENQEKKDKPAWKGNIEVSGWIKKDKNGKEYISLKIGQGLYANLFKQE